MITFADPDVIAPASALSPTLATGEFTMITLELPALTLATWSGHGGLGGLGCETVGSPTLATNLFSI